MRALIFSLMVPVLCCAQQAPVIAFDHIHFDFGRIGGEGKATHRFKVTNKGTGQLNISRLNPSCGCTSTVIGQWTLEPGQSTEIEATFNPAGMRGQVHKSIQVVCNDPATPTTTLTFEAEVLREINPSTEAVFLQDVIRGVPQKRSIKLASGNGKPVRPEGIKTPGAPWLSATVRPEGNDAWVDIVLDGKAIPAGRMMGTDAVVVQTGNPRIPNINLTVQWELHAAIVAEPIRLAWVEPAGRELRAKVVLKQVDGKPFRVLSAKTTHPSFTVEGVDKAAAAQHAFQVVLAAAAKAGYYTEKVVFTTDSPDQPEIELRVSAALR